MSASPDCYQKNELEMVLTMCEKLLKEKKGGVVFNKGTDVESKLSYAQAAVGLKSLRTYFAVQGTFSFSICKTCKRWNGAVSATGCFGKCGNNAGLKHQYETCSDHTPNKETWGL